MSNFASLPITVGLPSELSVANIDPIMPTEAKSQSIRVFAINNPTISANCATGATAVGVPAPDIQFPQQDINFDIPCSQSKDTFIDTRLSTLNYRLVITCGTAGTANIGSAHLRSSAYSFFDTLRVSGQSGGILEHFPEWGLTADTIMQGQMSQSHREGQGMNMGFQSNYSGMTNIGNELPALVGNPLVNGNTASLNFSVPLLSGVLGVMSDKFFPIGLTKKMLLTLTTTSILPITLYGGGTGTSSNFTVQLTDFWLNLETIQVGEQAFNQIASTLHDGKMYLHGQTYKTTTTVIPTGTSGVMNLPVGLTGSSVRSLFARFHETASAPTTATSVWGKYSSSNPSLNQYGWNIGGVNVPNYLYNPLLYPAQCFRSYLMALGSFNSTQFSSTICQVYYQRLTSAGTASGLNSSTTQDQGWDKPGSITYQNAFFLGENIETVPRRGLLSGRDLTFQKVNLVLSSSVASANPVNVYVHALMDCITIVDINSGEVVTII